MWPWDFVNDDVHPNDDNGHGTHVTGSIAQDTNNGYGVAGVAYNATIMPVKVIDWSGSGDDANAIDGIYWAVDHGAKVISMSLEFQNTGSPDGSGNYCTEITGLPAALDYAYAHNVTVVAAAGNEGGTVTCPGAYPTVIAVGASRFDGQTPSYSNFGPTLDIVAPGGDPSVDQNGDGFTDGVPQETYCDDYFTLLLLQDYGGASSSGFCDIFESGTSMATPHVAGAAALLLGENASLTPDQVRNYLQSTARDRGPAGWDDHYGWGALDAYAAVASLLGITPTPTPTGTPTATTTNTPTPTVTPTPCGSDADCDGVPDGSDNCASTANPAQANTDSGPPPPAGNTGTIDNGPGVAGNDGTVPDGDSAGDACDTDRDNDGLPDAQDTEPLLGTGLCAAFAGASDGHPNPAYGDNTADDDADGANAPPLGADTGDNGPSWDTDNDGVLDGYECVRGTNPRDASSKPGALGDDASDSDGDGLLNGWERRGWGTDPAKIDSDGDGKGDCKEAFDVTGDGVVNFPGDTIAVAKAANNIIAKSLDFDANKDGTVNFPGDAIASATRSNGIVACP